MTNPLSYVMVLMARMHTKMHGKSKSRKPMMSEATDSSGLGKEQIEQLIVELAKQGVPPALIGEKLKTEHKVQYIRKATGKRLMEILKDKKMEGEIPPDMMQLMRKAVNIREHMAANKRDIHGRIRLNRVESKIWRLTKYYIREGKLASGWRYDPEQAQLIIKGKA